MSEDIRKMINKVDNFGKSINEGRLKQINVTKDVLPYIEQAFYDIKQKYNNKYDLKGYTLSAFEFDKYHEYCPYGFDMDIDTENKRIHIEICSQNDGYNMSGFQDVIFDELESVFLGTIDFGGRKPFVKKTKYDEPIKYVDNSNEKLLKENNNNKLDAFYRLRDMRETGVVDSELGYSREFWKWLDSDEAIDIVNVLGDEYFKWIRDKRKNDEYFINLFS